MGNYPVDGALTLDNDPDNESYTVHLNQLYFYGKTINAKLKFEAETGEPLFKDIIVSAKSCTSLALATGFDPILLTLDPSKIETS